MHYTVVSLGLRLLVQIHIASIDCGCRQNAGVACAPAFICLWMPTSLWYQTCHYATKSYRG